MRIKDSGVQPAPKPLLTLPQVTNLATGEVIPIQQPHNLISMKAGTVARFRVEIHDSEGNRIPIDADFSLPLAGLLGTSPRVIDIYFAEGIAEFDVNWPDQGLWEVTENQVNMDIADPAQHFSFDGCRIKVRES